MNGRTLQALGSAYDKWVEELWHRRILNNCEMELAAAPDDNTILPPDTNNSSASSCLTKLFNWSPEISAAVKDEVTLDDAIVPIYNNEIILYVECYN